MRERDCSSRGGGSAARRGVGPRRLLGERLWLVGFRHTALSTTALALACLGLPAPRALQQLSPCLARAPIRAVVAAVASCSSPRPLRLLALRMRAFVQVWTHWWCGTMLWIEGSSLPGLLSVDRAPRACSSASACSDVLLLPSCSSCSFDRLVQWLQVLLVRAAPRCRDAPGRARAQRPFPAELERVRRATSCSAVLYARCALLRRRCSFPERQPAGVPL